MKVTHTRISNLHTNIVKGNSTMDKNKSLPNSHCKSLDNINLTERVTETGCAGKPNTCGDHMANFVARVASNTIVPKEEENGPGNHPNDGKNTPHHFGFKLNPKDHCHL